MAAVRHNLAHQSLTPLPQQGSKRYLVYQLETFTAMLLGLNKEDLRQVTQQIMERAENPYQTGPSRIHDRSLSPPDSVPNSDLSSPMFSNFPFFIRTPSAHEDILSPQLEAMDITVKA